MSDKPYYPENFEELIFQLDDDIATGEFSRRVSSNEFLKRDYEKQYVTQIDGYNMHRKKFGKTEMPITPKAYAKQLDDKLMADLRAEHKATQERYNARSEKQQEEELTPEQQKIADRLAREDKKEQFKENAQDKTEKSQQSDKGQQQEDPRRLAFRQRMKEMDQENAKKKGQQVSTEAKQTEKAEKQEEQNVDPRRLAFRQQMQEIEQENAKNKDRGYER